MGLKKWKIKNFLWYK